MMTQTGDNSGWQRTEGGWCRSVIELSNTRRTRTLSNLELLEAVARFLKTGRVKYLPPALRHEAAFIMAAVAEMRARPEPPWPSGAARPRPAPDATFAEAVRALVGDAKADEDSGVEGGS
jgi:hypothetical protein